MESDVAGGCDRGGDSAQCKAAAAIRFAVTLCRAIAIFLLTHVPSAAADSDIRARYEVTLAGLTIARADSVIAVRGNTYSIRVSYRTSGAAHLMGSATGEAVSSGVYKSGRLVPTLFNLDHKGSRRAQKVNLVMADGAVNAMTIDPPITAGSRGPPITPEHLKNIVDPVSALLAPALTANGRGEVGICDRTVQIFDGLRRFNLVLKTKEARTMAQGPYVGPLVGCQLQIAPIAGEVAGESSAEGRPPNRMLGETELTFGLANEQKIYIPVSLSAKIGYATLAVRLTQFTNAASN
ncbi:DUF3108 domain-containing protein [Bradyrhizobium sp. LMTR 3]|uniref:DUF3108 domain-containing protein n=1 Tax=Bradyrhizobium sp. LMTR 3 TaxID=189873 RepID=UPI000810C741|nr:DUF3108 domain-containing protein [Bradyrhizobium sp. LMTR 3]OCK55426.1 hypothetical protein LMTR3_11465 [Bradyrhizobium sp. LMTR 3]